jgi:salicylate biosynthesis isochorismate synthase/menaquinone-specific isochorismate synthase
MLGRRASRPGKCVSRPDQRETGEALLDAGAYERLARRVDASARKARGVDGATLVSVTCRPGRTVDPLAVLAAARDLGVTDAGWMEHPDRDGQALGGFGSCAAVSASGEGRFQQLSTAMATRTAGMIADDPFDDPEAPPGSGVAWIGGFAFADQPPRSNHWAPFGSANFVLPEVAVAYGRGGGEVRLTVNAVVRPGDDVQGHLERVERMVEALASAAVPQTTDPLPAGRAASSAGPDHYVNAVAGAVNRIRAGEFEKLVIARELEVEADSEYDPGVIAARLRDRFPECLAFAIVNGDRTYIGATPELLLRREGRRVSTMALAGSARRGLDPASDQRFGNALLASAKDREEHSIVVRRIERTLGRVSAWVASGREPELVRVKNIQHLATPIRAQLVEPRPALELAGRMHPTPAVGGEPWPQAAAAIKELEGFDRGWYTGCIGWTNALEDGELFVGLRCGLVEGRHVRLFAGAGIVAASDPEAELAETETKLEAMLPVVGG